LEPQDIDNVIEVKKQKKNTSRGIYIAFEGLNGSGKGEQVKLLMDRLRKEFPIKKFLHVREPGGTEIAEATREIFQVRKFSEPMHPICEQYLVAAARAQSLRVLVRPHLKKNGVVISDRTFFSSIAHQGFGRKLGYEEVMKINESAVDGIWPDLVIFIDTPVSVAMKRAQGDRKDKFDVLDKSFYLAVRRGYLFAAKKFPKLVKRINGDRTISEIHEEVFSIVSKLL
jgi:dTMP kinase